MLCLNITTLTDCHQWLLGEEVDVLPSLLLPLAGPEEFSEEETVKLPEDLQYLPNDKTREEDPDIRKMLLEALSKVIIEEKKSLGYREGLILYYKLIPRASCCCILYTYSSALPQQGEGICARSGSTSSSVPWTSGRERQQCGRAART